jgi:hypothetical protein
MRLHSFLGPSQQFFHAGFLALRTVQSKMQLWSAPSPQTLDQFVLYIFFGGEQTLETAFRLLIIAIYVD